MAKRPSFFANAFNLLKQTAQEWLDDKAPQLGAALAYANQAGRRVKPSEHAVPIETTKVETRRKY